MGVITILKGSVIEGSNFCEFLLSSLADEALPKRGSTFKGKNLLLRRGSTFKGKNLLLRKERICS